MKCSSLLEKFLNEQIIKGNTYETYCYYKKRIGYFISFINDKDIKKVTINDYIKYVEYLKSKNLSTFTIKTTLNSVKIFLNFAFNNKYIKSDIVKKIKPYKTVKKTIVVLNDVEIQTLLNSQDIDTLLGSRNLLIISLMLDAGLRVSEVCNLHVEDINENLELIKVFGKGQKERLVPLTSNILKYYKKYLDLSGRKKGVLIVDSYGNPLKPNGINQLLIKIKNKYGFNKLHPHFLRHTFATLFLVNGGDPIHLQIILGHSTLYMTMQYLHIAQQMTIAKQNKYSPLNNLKNKE